jgi:hypothetical protein
VNLYTASEAKLDLPGGATLRVRQETDYPNSGRVTLHLDPSQPQEFSVRLRIPRWCREAHVAINGQKEPERIPSGFFAVERRWQAGDRLQLTLPMPWRLVKGRQSQAGRVAVMRGPMVFGLSRQHHPQLSAIDPRLLTALPSSLQGPSDDDTVRPHGLAGRMQAWKPGDWYPHAPLDCPLVLTEFADPGLELVYFHVPDPNARGLLDDELSESGEHHPN